MNFLSTQRLPNINLNIIYAEEEDQNIPYLVDLPIKVVPQAQHSGDTDPATSAPEPILAPSISALSTLAPSTLAPSTTAPSTLAPSTSAPSTSAPSTSAISTPTPEYTASLPKKRTRTATQKRGNKNLDVKKRMKTAIQKNLKSTECHFCGDVYVDRMTARTIPRAPG